MGSGNPSKEIQVKVVFLGSNLHSHWAQAGVPQGCSLLVMPTSDPLLSVELATTDVLFAWEPVTREIIAAAPKLRLIQVLGAGIDDIDLEAAQAAGIPVATAGKANALAVAEHALTLMLCLCKRVLWAQASLRDGKWLQQEIAAFGLREVSGKTIGLIGFGAIGQALARLLSGFEGRRIYYDPRRPLPDLESSLGVSFHPLEKLLAVSDVTCIQVPLTESTRGMIGRRELDLMQRNAILVNIGRGEVIDEDALIEALVEGRIAGAGLDVFAHEPVPPDHPLLRLENVVLTPHIGGGTKEALARIMKAAWDNVAKVMKGNIPNDRVC